MSSSKDAKRRDVRVDYIGFVQELVKHWIEQRVKPDVKGDMRAGELVEGDCYLGRLDPCTCSEISPSGVFKLYKKGELTEAEFIELLSINGTAAAKVIDPKVLKRLTRTWRGTPRLIVTRKPGVHVEAIDAVRGLNQVLAGESRKKVA